MEKQWKNEAIDEYNTYKNVLDKQLSKIKLTYSSSSLKTNAIVTQMNLIFYKYLPILFEIISKNDNKWFDGYFYDKTEELYTIERLDNIKASLDCGEIQPCSDKPYRKGMKEGQNLINSLYPTLQLTNKDVYLIYDIKKNEYHVLDWKYRTILNKVLKYWVNDKNYWNN